jgi:tripartite ATP-independent transporter DctP family solute receptor
MKRYILFLVMFFIVLTFFASYTNQIFAETRKIQFGYVTAASKTDPYCIASTKFADLIKEKTDGEIELQLFPSGQLGNERDMIEGIQIGTLDAGLITNAPISGFVSSFMVLDLPFIFSDADNAHKTLDGPAGRALLDKLDTIGIKGLAFAEGGFRHMINNVRPIVKVEDVKGIKFRVMKNPVYIGLFKSLGSNAIPMPWGEVFTAVQQGVMDGLEIPISVTWSNNYFEVTKYLSLTGHTYSPLVFMVSKGVWNSLSPDYQKIFLESAHEAAVYERARVKEIEADLLNKLKEKGMEINEVPDKKPFQEAVKPLYEEFKEKIGAGVLKMVLEEAGKNQ